MGAFCPKISISSMRTGPEIPASTAIRTQRAWIGLNLNSVRRWTGGPPSCLKMTFQVEASVSGSYWVAVRMEKDVAARSRYWPDVSLPKATL